MPMAFALARDNAGNNIAARMAIIAITTSNSMSVNPRERMGIVFIRRDSRVVFITLGPSGLIAAHAEIVLRPGQRIRNRLEASVADDGFDFAPPTAEV